ncbi:MAG: hypothetical protein KGI00_01085 [Candidatus Micrarchaeota archaeon]|nr:hypothetical protein [Candidatus Micrarchaeota archaeon]MDE1823888.1 hypothetical protein [Candidatus Micrarchaeota archaeon]MDE1849302.1 hypothetical protein [Candidatus Micrarchaeota archaeon]
MYLPFEVIGALKLKENDEVDFIRLNPNSFAFAKKSDIATLLVGGTRARQEAAQEQRPEARAATQQVTVSDAELSVLKKLDTLRYMNRTPENVGRILNENEKATLKQLLDKKRVTLFKTNKGAQLYSIPKSIYDSFLMRKKQQAKPEESMKESKVVKQYTYMLKKKPESAQDLNVRALEQNGFVVVPTEGEASTLSLALEESIRQGLVLGTRAFNKKFYVVLRAFFERYSGQVIKELREGSSKVSEIADNMGLDEDGVRGILYLLSENGDVSEKKRDTFTLA